jgi:hypothetical protein
MSIFDRPKLAFLLCLTLVFGHVPAWLHEGSCAAERCCASVDGGLVHRSVSTQASSGSEKSLCCMGSVKAIASESASQINCGSPAESDEDQSQRSRGEHDTDDCVFCQWLASANGVTQFSYDVDLSTQVVCFVFAGASPLLSYEPVSNHGSRAPPEFA